MVGEIECVYLPLHKKDWQYVRDTKATIEESAGATWRMVNKEAVEIQTEQATAARSTEKLDLGEVALLVLDLHAKEKDGALLPRRASELRPAELKELLPNFSARVIIAAACYQGDTDKTCMAEWGNTFPDSLILVYSGGIENTVAAKDMRLIAEALAALGPDLPPAVELFEPLMQELDWDEHVRQRNARRSKSRYSAQWIVPDVTQ